MILELHSVTYIGICFGHCHVTFPYKEILSFFGPCHVTFPYMELLSFFRRFVQKVIAPCISDSFTQKTTQQSDGSCNVTSDYQFLYKLSKNSLFISANRYEKYILSKEHCLARHDDKISFLPNCRYHIILIGNIKDVLQKLNALCFHYQDVDCLFTLFKYRFSGEIFVKSGQLFDNLQRAVHFNQQNTGMDRMASIVKKRLMRKKYKKHLLSSLHKTKSTQTSGSVFADRIEQIEKTKFEMELIKIVDCFLDGYGIYTKNLASFNIKSNLTSSWYPLGYNIASTV